MDRDSVRKLLKQVQAGRLGIEPALQRLRIEAIGEMGFASLDLDRALRRGFPEVVYGAGKTVDQIVEIVKRLRRAGQTALVTRVGPEVHAAALTIEPTAEYVPLARLLVVRRGRKGPGRPGIVVVTAGTSDIAVAEEAAATAEVMGNRVRRVFDVGVAGLHRLMAHRQTLTEARVLIVVAGMEGALPSVVAGLVDTPVIAVPTSIGYGSWGGGRAALLAMLNSCAPGLAVVNIDNGFGAGYLGALINRRPAALRRASSGLPRRQLHAARGKRP